MSHAWLWFAQVEGIVYVIFLSLPPQATSSPPRLEDEKESSAKVALSKAVQPVDQGLCLLSSRCKSVVFPSSDLILCSNCITLLNLKLCQGETFWERGNPLRLSSNYPARWDCLAIPYHRKLGHCEKYWSWQKLFSAVIPMISGVVTSPYHKCPFLGLIK